MAAAGLLQQNESSANRVIADDEELDELEMTVDREGLHLLAFFSPVASDLKVVLASLRMSSMYERIGDEAVTIAKRANRLNKAPAHPGGCLGGSCLSGNGGAVQGCE